MTFQIRLHNVLILSFAVHSISPRALNSLPPTYAQMLTELQLQIGFPPSSVITRLLSTCLWGVGRYCRVMGPMGSQRKNGQVLDGVSIFSSTLSPWNQCLPHFQLVCWVLQRTYETITSRESGDKWSSPAPVAACDCNSFWEPLILLESRSMRPDAISHARVCQAWPREIFIIWYGSFKYIL